MQWKRTLTVVGAHAEGEVGNVITGGIIDVPGETMFDKKIWLENNADEIRRSLLFEPRGGPCHAVNVLLPATRPEADFGYVIMETTKYPMMSGSNSICVATVALETGIVPMTFPVTKIVMESPAGLIEATCQCRDGKVERVTITNVPAFVLHRDMPVELEGYGTIRSDICYGGIFFAIVDAQDIGFKLHPEEAHDLARLGIKLRNACNEQFKSEHPLDPNINGISNIEFVLPPAEENGSLRARNAVVCGNGRIDRSPCGTGTSARLALLDDRGEIESGQIFDHESLIGTCFRSKIIEKTSVGEYPGVITTISGQAWITGISQYGVDPTDPFPAGHQLSDIWFS